jgi:hypothetical protein
MSAELSALKHEVEALWARYRKDEPGQVDDEARRALSELNRALEKKRRALSDRSAALRQELEAHRRRASRLSPLARVLGGLVGSALVAGLIGAGLPALGSHALELSVGQGVVLLSASLLVAAWSVSPADR